MTARIKQELIRLEQEQQIRILYAVESGSRAWGFASQDSDWDVRFIYVHQLEWYLQIDEDRDSYEEMLDCSPSMVINDSSGADKNSASNMSKGANIIDFAGWELRKTLKLYKKSNQVLFEWLNSPIVYREEGILAEKLRDLAKDYFNAKACIYHYLNMAETKFKSKLSKEKTTLKQYLYALRPLLACSWIVENNSPPPIVFQELIDSQLRDEAVKSEISELLKIKSAGIEAGEISRIVVLYDFIQEQIKHFRQLVVSLDKPLKTDTDVLNLLFREIVKEPVL